MGFPARPIFADFGQAHLNYSDVVDPERDLDIAHWVLMKHQVAGMGLLSPRIIAKLTVSGASALLARGEAWNPSQLTSGVYANPIIANVATGRATIEYPTAVPDEQGVNQSVAFTWAYAFVHQDPPTTFRMAMAAPLIATPYKLSVSVFDAAGALQNGSDVWVYAG
jgi:hypothetical protein